MTLTKVSSVGKKRAKKWKSNSGVAEMHCYNFFLGEDYADFTEKFKKRIRVFRVIRA